MFAKLILRHKSAPFSQISVQQAKSVVKLLIAPYPYALACILHARMAPKSSALIMDSPMFQFGELV
jgi:hypothetical protein